MNDINKLLKTPFYKGCSEYGAQMGRSYDNSNLTPEPLLLQKVKFIDGDYDCGGAYWGGCGSPLYCAFSPENTNNPERAMVFVRANSRKEAKGKALANLKGDWTFVK